MGNLRLPTVRTVDDALADLPRTMDIRLLEAQSDLALCSAYGREDSSVKNILLGSLLVTGWILSPAALTALLLYLATKINSCKRRRCVDRYLLSHTASLAIAKMTLARVPADCADREVSLPEPAR